MTRKTQIIGSYISPYVRKVLVFLELKGVPYEIDPITPFLGDDRFSQISPLRRIPVLVDDLVTLSDSSVICQYLEERYRHPQLYPGDLVQRARARWLEEYADTRMGEVFIWRLFNELVIKPFVWGEQTDPAVVNKALTEDIPQVLSYLESEVPIEGFLFSSISIADVAIATFFRNAAFARFIVDADRWPKTAAFIGRVLATDGFVKLKPFEKQMMRTPIPQQREALAEMGAPLTRETHGTTTPRRGMMGT